MEQQVGTEDEVPKPHQVVTKQQALRMLETYFGYTFFRPAQEAPIASLLRNEDVIGIMPTGAGKSICFQKYKYYTVITVTTKGYYVHPIRNIVFSFFYF
uniref:DEAD/DEAH box helicase n=1 Tax=Veillonella sp. TaxID=1926307 RepID=UPI00359F3889